MKKERASKSVRSRRQLPLPLVPRQSAGLSPRQQRELLQVLAELLLEAAGAGGTEVGHEPR
jgi:hypothetical protein